MRDGLVFNIQKYSLQDGPGIRTTAFLKGCPLSCLWCHNPESQSAQPEIVVAENRCLACGACRCVCPFAAARPGTGPIPARMDDCSLCGECLEACPTGARQMIGQRMTVAEVMAEIARDTIFYDDSAGGVTISGGEPLSQPAFVKELLEACHARGLRTAVDTCGFAGTDVLLDTLQHADLVLFDLKHMDAAKHAEYTGVSNQPILANLQALGEVHPNIWVRVPLIPGVNDDAANLEATARFAARVPGVRQVSVLPYHKTGILKFRRLGRVFELGGLEPPSAEAVEKATETFRSFGLCAKAGY